MSSVLSPILAQSFKKLWVLANLMASQDVVSHEGQYQVYKIVPLILGRSPSPPFSSSQHEYMSSIFITFPIYLSMFITRFLSNLSLMTYPSLMFCVFAVVQWSSDKWSLPSLWSSDALSALSGAP